MSSNRSSKTDAQGRPSVASDDVHPRVESADMVTKGTHQRNIP